jgi:hypothetical protein
MLLTGVPCGNCGRSADPLNLTYEPETSALLCADCAGQVVRAAERGDIDADVIASLVTPTPARPYPAPPPQIAAFHTARQRVTTAHGKTSVRC